MYEVFMMGVPYLHEDLPEGEFDTLEEAIECADEKFFECYVTIMIKQCTTTANQTQKNLRWKILIRG